MQSRIVSVPDEAELGEALAEAARGVEGWITGTGFVEDAEVRVGGDGKYPLRRARGRHAVASLGGPAGGPYGVVLARDGEPVVAGHLARARAFGVTLFVSATVFAEHAASEPTAADAPPRPSAELGARAASPAKHPWAAAASAVAAAESRDAPAPAPVPKGGDRVLHFAFGLCDVLSARGSRLHIRDLSGAGRIRELVLETLEIQPPYEKDGKRVFRLSRKS
ncbi:MAG: hypothetical protein OZ921_05515 [Sorangiineae bacterium]|nr:hypothetical protein [Polyangiaceae bacterium]MEB2321952.1 hypothetical protein [Sorangiineae bacterium]